MLVTEMPSNLRLDMSGDRRGVTVVDSDLYKIADRVKEIDPRLMIVYHDGHPEPFTVMEQCADGVTRFVARYAELDQRILEDLRYMASVPFDERIKITERKIDAANAALEAMDEETMDWLAVEMRRELIKAGLSDPIGQTYYGYNSKRKKA
jgi:hypothetical protein